MKKIIFAAVAALTLSLGSAAFAQAPSTGTTPPSDTAKPGTTEAGKTDAKKESKKDKKPGAQSGTEKSDTAAK
jgi:hypothetical protein